MNEQPPPPPPSQPPAAASSSAAALASLILGILAMVLSVIVLGGVLGIVGLLLGAVHLRRHATHRGMAWWGVAFSSVAILASIGLGFAYYAGYQKVRELVQEMNTGASSVDLNSWVGVAAPDITVATLDGETIKLSNLKGKRVVLDFWATWCPPCVKEIPHFIELSKEIPRDELVIIGISKEEPGVLAPFVKKHRINYPIASASDLPSPYSDVTGIPTTFFIDRNGIIQSVITGYHDVEALRSRGTGEDFQGEPRTAPVEEAKPEP